MLAPAGKYSDKYVVKVGVSALICAVSFSFFE